MAYTLDFSLALGPGKTGLTDLRAQLVDTTGASVGSAVSTGFVEIGTSGNYLWHYAAFPDAHRGGVKFYSNAAPTVFLLFAAINPEEAENTDVESSSLATAAALQVVDDFVDTEVPAILAAVDTEITALITSVGLLPTATQNAEAVLDEALAGHLSIGSAGAALNAAGSAGDPWIALLPGAYGAGTAGYIIGNFPSVSPAAIEFTYTVTSTLGGTPIEGVYILISTDSAGSNIVWSGYTDAFGVAKDANGNLPRLDIGTYFIFRQKSGFVFNDPDSETVS